ncbi:MAG TPA: HDOD domain-containing protein [Noviherbaspirillum sp.]|nr:HDOD domain-containing protein [Noviherbaspirillum sp.]
MNTSTDSDTLEPANAEQTMALLWSRVRQRGDLPGFSKVVGAIIGAMHDDDDREFNMTKTVLQDPALTQKVLRLANSAMYSVFGQGINTVSKAVIVLGTEAIGHLAIGLKLIEDLAAASADSAVARMEMEKAVLAGHVARHVASSAGTRDAEEAVVCAMLHSLGRMMTTFYLYDQWQRMQECRIESGLSEEQAALYILGLSLDEVGRQVAQQWGLPATLVQTMRDVAPEPVSEPLGHADWLAAVSTLSSHCASVLCANEEASDRALSALAQDYADMLGLERAAVLSAVNSAQKSVAEEEPVVVRPLRRVEFDKAMLTPRRPVKPADATTILTRGIADIRGALHAVSISQLMTMALETVFQGLGFARSIAFLRDIEQSQYAARMYFGDLAQEVLPRLSFGDAYQPDVFHAALANDKMIFIENAQDAAFANKLPRWWRQAFPVVRSFLVLPLTINRQPVGFLYGDWSGASSVAKIAQAEAALLDELRMLIVRAVEQRRQMEASWARKML